MITLESSPAAEEPLAGIFDWGIQVIEAAQAALPSFSEPVFLFFTLLGEPITYLVIIAALFWCIDERKAARCGVVLFVSAGINTALKETWAIPRPFIRTPGINRIAETGFSTPSGHSQNSAAFWPLLLLPRTNRRTPLPLPRGNRRVRLIAAISLPFVIGISRIYLGVHYPTDVLLGWSLGASISVFSILILPLLAAKIRPALHAWFPNRTNLPVSVQIAGVAAGVFLLNTFSGGDTRMSGILFGYTSGYLLLISTSNETLSTSNETPRFSAASGSAGKKVIRFILGFIGIALLYVAGETVCNSAGTGNLPLCRFVQYALAGFWISRLAPELFVRTGLQ